MGIIAKYLSNVGLALSIFINALIGGESNQTLSARAFKQKISFWCLLVDFLFADKDHCYTAYIRHVFIKEALIRAEDFINDPTKNKSTPYEGF